MTVRAKNRSQQWEMWTAAALVALVVYVVLSCIAYGSLSWDLLDPRRYRLAMPILVLFGLVAWETRWDGQERETGEKRSGRGKVKRSGGGKVRKPGEGEETRPDEAEARDRSVPLASAPPPRALSPLTGAESGEALYARARTLPHQVIPDFAVDGEYLGLLGKAVAAGYAPAMAKLGEYAMRRRKLVEAYYWMWRARQGGMKNLSGTLRDIRMKWAMAGAQEDAGNVNGLFSREAGSIGRALLDLDSGRKAPAARRYLQANHPEFLESRPERETCG